MSSHLQFPKLCLYCHQIFSHLNHLTKQLSTNPSGSPQEPECTRKLPQDLREKEYYKVNPYMHSLQLI